MGVAVMRTKRIWGFLVMCCLAGTAARARAAGPYSLTCDAARSGTFTIALTGFTFKVTGDAAEGAAGKPGAHPTSFELQVRFAPGTYYQSMLATVQTGEVMRSCQLMDGEGGGGMTAMPRGNFNSRTANSSAGGVFTWTFTNAAVTSVTAIGGTLPSGVMEGQIQATLSAEKYAFSM
jgi:hypothetical protein